MFSIKAGGVLGGTAPAMPYKREHWIPAAGIGDLDLETLAQTNPEAAKEIVRLRDRMDRGQETKEEFLRLCRLLFDVGATAASEYLLRRNLDYYEGATLYAGLFGATRQEEFDVSIGAFKAQFNVELRPVRRIAFLVSVFCSDSGPPRSDDFALLSRPCEIKFGYVEQDRIEAHIWPLDTDEDLLLFFVNGVWEIGDSSAS